MSKVQDGVGCVCIQYIAERHQCDLRRLAPDDLYSQSKFLSSREAIKPNLVYLLDYIVPATIYLRNWSAGGFGNCRTLTSWQINQFSCVLLTELLLLLWIRIQPPFSHHLPTVSSLSPRSSPHLLTLPRAFCFLADYWVFPVPYCWLVTPCCSFSCISIAIWASLGPFLLDCWVYSSLYCFPRSLPVGLLISLGFLPVSAAISHCCYCWATPSPSLLILQVWSFILDFPTSYPIVIPWFRASFLPKFRSIWSILSFFSKVTVATAIYKCIASFELSQSSAWPLSLFF